MVLRPQLRLNGIPQPGIEASSAPVSERYPIPSFSMNVHRFLQQSGRIRRAGGENEPITVKLRRRLRPLRWRSKTLAQTTPACRSMPISFSSRARWSPREECVLAAQKARWLTRRLNLS